jgi:hypothetical protein
MSQENNAESPNGLRRAVWFAWLRQDVWAAFQAGRPAMTIFRPRKRLSELTSDELAARIIFISAKAVQFAANNTGDDVTTRIARGKALLKMLEDWKQMLPITYAPIECSLSQGTNLTRLDMDQQQCPETIFRPIWIHPQSYAAAIQTFHFSRIVVLLHETTTNGPAAYRMKENMLSESMHEICGIALAEQSQNLASIQCSLQALFAGMSLVPPFAILKC